MSYELLSEVPEDQLRSSGGYIDEETTYKKLCEGRPVPVDRGFIEFANGRYIGSAALKGEVDVESGLIKAEMSIMPKDKEGRAVEGQTKNLVGKLAVSITGSGALLFVGDYLCIQSEEDNKVYKTVAPVDYLRSSTRRGVYQQSRPNPSLSRF